MKNGNPKTSWLEWSNFWSLQKISVFPVGKIWIVCSGNFAWIHGWNPVKRSCIFWIRFVSCTSVFFLDMLAKITMIGSDPWTKKIFRMGSFGCSTNFWYMFHEFPHVCKEGLLPYHHLLNKWLQGCIFRGIPTKWARKKKRPYFPGYSVFNRDPYLKKQPIIAMELGRGSSPIYTKNRQVFLLNCSNVAFFYPWGILAILHRTPWAHRNQPTTPAICLPQTIHFASTLGGFLRKKWWVAPRAPNQAVNGPLTCVPCLVLEGETLVSKEASFSSRKTSGEWRECSFFKDQLFCREL